MDLFAIIGIVILVAFGMSMVATIINFDNQISEIKVARDSVEEDQLVAESRLDELEVSYEAEVVLPAQQVTRKEVTETNSEQVASTEQSVEKESLYDELATGMLVVLMLVFLIGLIVASITAFKKQKRRTKNKQLDARYKPFLSLLSLETSEPAIKKLKNRLHELIHSGSKEHLAFYENKYLSEIMAMDRYKEFKGSSNEESQLELIRTVETSLLAKLQDKKSLGDLELETEAMLLKREIELLTSSADLTK